MNTLAPTMQAERCDVMGTPAVAIDKLASRGVKSKISKNKVNCGDVVKFLTSLRGEALFDLALIDPPYNIGKDFGTNNDSKNIADYVKWSITYINECLRLIKPAAPVYIYGYPEILAHIAVQYPLERQRWLAWHYTNKTVPTSKFWQRSFESILCLWKGNKPKLNVDDIREAYTDGFLKNAAGKLRKSKHCRYSKGVSQTVYQAHEKGALPRDVIAIPALAGGSGYAERVLYCKTCDEFCMGQAKQKHNDCEVLSHPTQKPLKLTERLIKGSSPETILIPFAGTGSECIVAKKLGIDFYATDINPEYVKLANKWLKVSQWAY